MRVITEHAKTYREDPARQLDFARFSSQAAGDFTFFAGYFDFKALDTLPPDERVVYLELEEPNRFMVPPSAADFHHLDRDERFAKIFTLCPFSAEWLNRRHGTDRWVPAFFPFNEQHAPAPAAKEFDVIYTGGAHGSGIEQLIQVIRGFNYRFVSQTKHPAVTDFNCSYTDKLSLIARSRVTIVHNLLFPGRQHVEQVWRFPDWRANAAFSHLPEAGSAEWQSAPAGHTWQAPQLKSRLFEAAFCRSLILCQRDPWNVIERFFEPGTEFIYFEPDSLADTLRDILANFARYEAVIARAHARALRDYTTTAFFEKFLRPLGGAKHSAARTREPFAPGELVFDVGANVGDKAAEFLARGARVVCFEPQPDCAARLRERFAGEPRAVIEAVGLAAEAGELELSICSAANTISTFSADWKRGRFANYQWDRHLRVPVITLDEAIARHGRPAYVKVDVEGFELDVLRGLSSRVPLLSFEFTAEFLARNRECAQHLESLGFREFNAKLGTAENYLSDRWLPAEELFARLSSSPDPDLWGDIYARTETENPATIPSFLDELRLRKLWHTGQPLKLHLGCGEQHFEGYVNVDYPPAEHTCQTRVGADIFADITKLRFPPQSVDEIRLHHVFEHFTRADALALLIRWHEALKVGGRLHLETPDLEGCARQFVSDIPLRMKQAVVRHCFGSQEAGWANHYDGWTEARFQHVLSQLGFSVQARASSWPHPPHLANVEAFATKRQHLSRPELLAAADRMLSEYTVADVPSEREMCEVWRRAMRAFLAANGSAPVTGVIFSKDRPLQLDGTLRSFFARCRDASQCRIKVLYRASAECQPHYDVLVREYPTVEFIAEQDFRNDLLNLLSGSELVLFLVDDNLFVRDFTLAEVADTLRQRPAALGFSLRLGRNTTFCYPFNKSQNLPPFEAVAPRVLSCDWTKAEGDFNYPLEVSSSAYRTADVLPLLRESSFQNPNTLESELAARASRLTSKPRLLCFEASRAFCNPINMVQRICPNRAGGRAEHSPEQLARQFGVGARLDVEAYKDFTPIGCHQEVPLRFIPAAASAELAVSIVVPCFKQAHYLPDAIQSVLAQTFTDWEVIIVNDGSPDDTSRVARELIARHPGRRIRLLEIANGGPGRARNAGIREARGKFILPLDADDQIAPEFLAKTVAYLEKHPDVPIVGTYRKDFGLANQVHPASDYTLAMILEDNRLNYCSLYRREIWQSVGGYDPARAIGYEDWSFWISCAERGWFARCIPEPLFLYRVKSESRFTETQARDAMQRAQIVLRHAASYTPQRVAAAQRVVDQATLTAPASQKIPAPLPSGSTQNSPTVSVIVPTFNRPAMLLETLRSILTQSYPDFEIIVINDAGEDVTPAIATLGDSRKIRHLRHEVNKGLAAARNTGIKAARGKYIAYLDDDDIFQSNHLQTLVEHLEATQGDVAYTDAYRAHQRKNGDAYEVFARDVPYSFEFDYDRILEKNFIPVLCFMHRKTCWEAAGGFDESLPVLEDWDLWIRMSRLYDFTHIAKVTCEFRWRTDGSTMTLARNEKFARTTDIIVAKRAHLPARKKATGAGPGKRLTDQPVSAPGLPAQDEFDELAYLRANPDVAAAVLTHSLESGWQHYVKYGSAERRPWFRKETAPAEAEASMDSHHPSPATTDYDILVPIFNAPDDVRRCVESLLRHTESRHTIYLLDDASPDKRIAPLLAGFASKYAHIKVVTAEKNGGFVANMNRGFGLSRRDVIILNSDTEVTPGWLDRMDRCRRSDACIGIVCPLSNNATILSVPAMNARNTLPPGMKPDQFAALVEAHSERLYPRIPTAIGFCMLITRDTLDAVGLFDPAFGLGYGEENDLCLRAWAAGKQSACCDDAYVQHYGEASFGQVEGIGERRRRNAELLDRRWPGYSASVYRYCQSNPLRKLQERLRAALSNPNDRRPSVLQVIHNYNAPGGTELHTQDIVERVSGEFRQTVVFPGTAGNWTDFAEVSTKTGTRLMVFNQLNAAPTHRFLGQPGDVRNAMVEENFRQFVAGGDYDLIHFQHLAGWASLRLPRIARELGKRCVLSVHDYFLHCPEYVLINSDGQRCDKPRARAADADCLRCLGAKRHAVTNAMPPVAEYLQERESLSEEVLEMMDAVIVPSEFVRRRILGAFGERFADQVRVIPHGVTLPRRSRHPKPGTPLRVGILGSLNLQKGLREVVQAAALLQDAPVQLEIFGYVPPAVQSRLSGLSIKEHGGYRREQLPTLLRDVDLILIPSLFDETFCLTLSEAQALGIPVLASAVGAIPERIVEGETGFLFSPATGEAMAAKLRALAQTPDRIHAVGERIRKLSVRTMDQNAQDYAALYRQLLERPVRKETPAPAPETSNPEKPSWQTALTQKPDQSSLTSIIILTWNQLEHTRRCVESIAAHTPEPHELIFVDNGSTDGTVAWLREYANSHQHVRLIENQSNRGFAGGNNQGLSIAKGDFVLLLNNDTIVTPGWLGGLLRVAATDPRIGLVGPMSNSVSGAQLVPRVPYRTPEMLAAFATPWAVGNAGQIQSAVRLVGFCLLMRRAVMEAVGGLDERYGSGNFEDDDFCTRVRLAGFGIVIAKEVFVHHVGSQTFKGAKIDYRQAMLRNWELFRAKWQLPADVVLEQGYPFPKQLPPGVSLHTPIAPLTLTHTRTDERFWKEPTPVTPPESARKETPRAARLGQLDDARAALGRRELAAAWAAAVAALNTRPFHPEACLLLAEIALAGGDAANARLCAQRAAEMSPRWNAPKQFLKKPLKGGTSPDWLKLPQQIRNPKSEIRNRLTIGVLTKNEERFIAQCLNSVKGVADQIIVVDTGSTDRTIEIAKSLGAEVHSTTWADDFSAPRNLILEHATGDWILMLDADEELPADQHTALRADLRKAEAIAHRLPLVNRGQEAEGQSHIPRLFRNAPGAYYYGRIHEQVFPSLLPLCKTFGLDTALGTARLLHHGYTKELVKDRNKVERNLRLLRLGLEERPHDINLTLNLGLELVRSGEVEAGIAQYRDAFRLMSAQKPNEVVPELREVLLTQFTSHLYKVNAHDEVVQVLNSQLAKQGGGLTASMHFALGLSHFELKHNREAAEQMRQCLAKLKQPALSPINTDILTAAPHHCLALSLARLDDATGAEKAFQAGLSATAKTEDLRVDYARFLAAQGRPVDALQRLNEVVQRNTTHVLAWRLGGEIALSQPAFLEFARDWTAEAARQLPEEKAVLAQRAEALLLSQELSPARPLWERACNGSRAPQALAAIILCATVEAQPAPSLRDATEEVAVSRAFIEWYRRLVTFEARETVLQVNQRLDVLSRTLPGAARLLERVRDEATREETATL